MGMFFKEGDWVWHKKMGVGQVSLSSDKEVLVEFSGGVEEIFEVGPRKRPPLNALNKDGFWLRKKDDHDSFAATLREQPLEALIALVNDQVEEISSGELKDLIVPHLVSEADWDVWHKKLLLAARSDPRFNVGKGDSISYQGELFEIAEEMLARFKKAPSLKEKQKITREMLQLEQKGVPVDDLKEAAILFFTGTTISRTNKMGARLEALLFLKDLDPIQYGILKDPLIGEINSLTAEKSAEAVSEVIEANVRRELLNIVRELKPDEFIEITFMLAKRFKKMQRDWTLDTLLGYEDKSFITTIIGTTMCDIATNMQPFVWLFKALLEKPEALVGVGPEPGELIKVMFKMLNNMHFTSVYSRRTDDVSITREEDELVKILLDWKKIFRFLDKQSKSLIGHFVSFYFECIAIEVETREDFVKKAMDKFPGIELIEERPKAEDDSIQLTKEAYVQFRAEYQDIVDDKLTQALNEVKTAREWGDISDNAELRIAQERQRTLQTRKSELERLFETCRIIEQ
jgi:transcription elongation factor GreA-like protein